MDFIERLINEKAELNVKTLALEGFINSEKFSSVSPVQKHLLKIQLHAMQAYLYSLNMRIIDLKNALEFKG